MTYIPLSVLNYLSVLADLWQSHQCFSSAKAEAHVYFIGTRGLKGHIGHTGSDTGGRLKYGATELKYKAVGLQ